MTTLIAFLGPAGAGKTTAAKHLEQKYGAKRYSLAGLLKLVAKRTLDFTDAQLYGTQEEKEAIDPRYGFSCRWYLQRLGTEGVRDTLGAEFWTKACLEQIARDAPDLAVIDDARFVNEAELIMHDPSVNGFVWRLNPPEDALTEERETRAGAHSSETEWITAPVDVELFPGVRGVRELCDLIDEAMMEASQ